MSTLISEKSPRIKIAASAGRVMDTFPVTVSVVEQGGRRLRFKKPFVFSPFIDDSRRLLVIEVPGLSLSVFASTRARLLKDLKTEISFLWDEYALASDDDLSTDARVLKQILLSLLEASDE